MEVPVIKVRSSIPIINILDIYQRRRTEESCDLHIICQDGYIPCHKFILMANSNFLNQLIIDNLSDIGHMDNRSIISLSFPEFKTRHMAHVISMFYTGKSVCYLGDIFYIRRIMEAMEIKFSTPKKATINEISNVYKPRYFISEYDSDIEEEANESRFTTNAFCALRQLRSSNSQGQKNLKPAECDHLKNTITKEIKKEIVTDEDNNSTTIDLPTSTKESFEPQNTIDAPAINKHAESGSNRVKLVIKGKNENIKTDPKTENVEPVSKNTSYPQTSTVRKEKSEGEITEGKRKAADESDCEFDSADSALEIIRVRKRKLRKRTPKQQEGSLIKPRLKKSRKRAGKKLTANTVKEEPIMRDASEPETDDNAFILGIQPQCTFCFLKFVDDERMGFHLSRTCGKHLKGTYSIPTRKCYFCHKKFRNLNMFDFITHVQSCYQAEQSKKDDNKEAPTRKSYRIMEAAKKEKNEFDESQETLNSPAATDIKVSSTQTTESESTDRSDTVNLTMNSLLEEIDNDIEEFERHNFGQRNCDPRSEIELPSPVDVQSDKESQEYESTKDNICLQSLSPKTDPQTSETPSITFPLDISRVVQRYRDECFKGNPERNNVNEPSTSEVFMAQSSVPCPETPSPQPVGFPVPKIPGLTQSPPSAEKTLD